MLLFYRFVFSSDQQYRYLYFNHMNLAQKSSVHSRKSSLPCVAPEIMRLMGDISADFARYYQILEQRQNIVNACSQMNQSKLEAYTINPRQTREKIFMCVRKSLVLILVGSHPFLVRVCLFVCFLRITEGKTKACVE